MRVAAVDMEPYLAELSDRAFEAFCEDISGIFHTTMTCERQEVGTDTVAHLRTHFKRLAAIHHVEATGTLDGPFYLLFDQGGLFVLSGVVVMLPESRVRDEVNRGSIEDTENLADVCHELGNLLVNSWDRVFRKDCEGHGDFLKTSTFIGMPWENTDESSLFEDDGLLFVIYRMTVEPYPRFTCAAVFPKPTLERSSAAPPEPAQAPAAESQTPQDQEQTEEVPQDEMQPKGAPVPSAEPEQTPPPADVEPPHRGHSKPEDIPGLMDLALDPVRQPVQVAAETETPDAVDPPEIPEDIRPVVETVVGEIDEEIDEEVDLNQAQSDGLLEPADSREALAERVFADSLTHVPEGAIMQVLEVQAADIMTTDVVWCNPEEAVQNVIEAMQQHNTGYALVGSNGALQGLVSNSNILSAVSPYLRPMFAKWRRPEDDATLQIKIKWIMSRPVRTVTPDTTLGSLAEIMRRYGGRCLPVVDKQGKVHGIITVFDILLRILEAGQAFSWKGKPPQAPAFLI